MMSSRKRYFTGFGYMKPYDSKIYCVFTILIHHHDCTPHKEIIPYYQTYAFPRQKLDNLYLFISLDETTFYDQLINQIPHGEMEHFLKPQIVFEYYYYSFRKKQKHYNPLLVGLDNDSILEAERQSIVYFKSERAKIIKYVSNEKWGNPDIRHFFFSSDFGSPEKTTFAEFVRN
jgi:hypothetical protein